MTASESGNFFIGIFTLCVFLIAHAVYIGYRMGKVIQALEDTIRRVAANEDMLKKIHSLEEMNRRMGILERYVTSHERAGHDVTTRRVEVLESEVAKLRDRRGN
jgi:hypothetical protein